MGGSESLITDGSTPPQETEEAETKITLEEGTKVWVWWEEKDKAVKEAPPPPKWDEDIFSSKPSVKPAEANKAAMNFAPAPRAKAPPAFGPRPTPGNELDELD